VGNRKKQRVELTDTRTVCDKGSTVVLYRVNFSVPYMQYEIVNKINHDQH
jgi:hypothetical protein